MRLDAVLCQYGVSDFRIRALILDYMWLLHSKKALTKLVKDLPGKKFLLSDKDILVTNFKGFNEEVEKAIDSKDSTWHFLLLECGQFYQAPCRYIACLFQIGFTFDSQTGLVEPCINLFTVHFAATKVWEPLGDDLAKVRRVTKNILLPCVDLRGDLAATLIVYFNTLSSIDIDEFFKSSSPSDLRKALCVYLRNTNYDASKCWAESKIPQYPTGNLFEG